MWTQQPGSPMAGSRPSRSPLGWRMAVGTCIQHDHPVRLGECRPAVALVAYIGECRCRWPAWRHHVRLASCSGSIIVGGQTAPVLGLHASSASHSGNDARRRQPAHPPSQATCTLPAAGTCWQLQLARQGEIAMDASVSDVTSLATGLNGLRQRHRMDYAAAAPTQPT